MTVTSYWLIVLTIVSGSYSPIMSQVDSDCSNTSVLNPGQTYYVENPGYPDVSVGEKFCRWIALTEFGYTINMTCSVEIPTSPNCQEEALLISKREDPSFQYAQRYCGTRNFQMMSDNLTIGFVSREQSNGSRFRCVLMAITECECGWALSPRIVGGEETQANELPFMAGVVDTNRKRIICGASIISKKFVVTAAHCARAVNRENIRVVVGEHDVTTGNDSNYTKVMQVANIIIHENYSGSVQNDIALLETSSEMVWSRAIGPICLPFMYRFNRFVGAKVEIAGWGRVGFYSNTSDVLQKASTQVISNGRCQGLSLLNIPPSAICTFKTGTDACQMDSGGPVYLRKRRVFLLGIIASGVGCDGLGYNERITSFLNWITRNTNANFCKKSIT